MTNSWFLIILYGLSYIHNIKVCVYVNLLEKEPEKTYNELLTTGVELLFSFCVTHFYISLIFCNKLAFSD